MQRSHLVISSWCMAAALGGTFAAADVRTGFPADPGGAAPVIQAAGGVAATALESGIQVRPATGLDRESWELGMRLSGFGRRGEVRPVAMVQPVRSGEGVQYRRGELTEWYVRHPEGIEQGFTLETRPAGPAHRPLVLELSLGGDLVAISDAGGRGVHFSRPSGQVQMTYGGLVAFDATGRELPSRLGACQSRLWIEVDDADAAYPVIIDPLMSAPAWIQEGDLEGAFAGQRIRVVGDVNGDGYDDVLVTRIRPGSVSLYLGSPSGLSTTTSWVFRPVDHGSQGPNVVTYQDIYLGAAGDVNGDGYADVILGFPYHTLNGGGEGRAWVFLGSPTGLEATAVWAVNGEVADANFGWWVNGAGDINGDGYGDILVGAPFHSVDYLWAGKAYAYLGSATGPSTTPVWQREAFQDFANFGRHLSSAGDVNGDGFDDILVSAPGFNNPESGEGVVFLYYGAPAGLNPTPLILEMNRAGAAFGTVAESAGDINGDGYADVVVSAPNHSNPQVNEGAVFAFYGSASGLSTTPVWWVEGNFDGLKLGRGLAGAGDLNGDGYDDIVVGTPNAPPSGGSANTGQARVYLGSATGLAPSPSWIQGGLQSKSEFGWALAGLGDTDGDGYHDVLIGAPLFQNALTGEGAAYLFRGCLETDGDGVCNVVDNCPALANQAQANADGDVAGDDCDCAPADAQIWSAPGPVVGLSLAHDTGLQQTTLSWQAPASPGGSGAPVYDVVRAGSSDDFVAGAACLASASSQLSINDSTLPPPGGVHSYLVRPRNACAASDAPVGSSSLGVPRAVRACP